MSSRRPSSRTSSNRTSSNRTSSGRSRRPAAKSSSSNAPLILGGAVVALLVVIGVVFFNGGGNAEAEEKPGAEPAASSSSGAQPARPAARRSTSPSAPRGGKSPTTPAPTITPAILAEAERHYEAAKAKWNEGQNLRKAGETASYGKALQDAYVSVEALEAAIEPCSDWYLQADIEGWAMSADYVAFGKRLAIWDRLSGKIQKLKPN